MASFTLGTSTFSQDNPVYVELPFSERGTSLEVEWAQSGASQDIRLHGWAVRFVPGELLSLEWPAVRSLPTGTAYGSGAYGAGAYGGVSGAGSVTGTFMLDISALGLSGVARNTVPIGDRGRSIQVEWDQAGSNQDFRVHGWALHFKPAEPNAMERS